MIVHRVYLCLCVYMCVLRVFSNESDDRDRREAANNVPGYRGGTTRYDRFVRSPETKRFLANGAHLSFMRVTAHALTKEADCHRQLSSIRGGGRWEKRAHDRGKVVEMSCELRFPDGSRGWVLFPMDCCFEFALMFDVRRRSFRIYVVFLTRVKLRQFEIVFERRNRIFFQSELLGIKKQLKF